MNYLRQLQFARLMNAAETEDGAGPATPPEGDPKPPESFTPEQVKLMVEEAVGKVKSDWEADVQGLKKNRDDLKQEKIDLAKKMANNATQQQLLDADERDLAKIQGKIRSEIKDEYEAKIKSTSEELDNLKKTLDNKTINGALDAQLNDLKVKSSLRNALKAEILLGNKAAVVDGQVLLGETPLQDFFSEWQKTDSANDFIVADPSSGGGSSGSAGSQPSGAVNLLNMSGHEAMKYALANPTKK